jgi:hypothetical protein
MEGSMSMDSILSRFSNFNTEMTKRASLSGNNDDDDDDDDEDDDDSGAAAQKNQTNEEDGDKDAIMKERDQEYESSSASNVKPTSVEIKGEEPLVKEFADNNYWKVNILEEKSLEELMAEMEI